MASDSTFETDEFLYAEVREDNTMSYSKGSSSCGTTPPVGT
ncbi:hypothetical protein [Streptomyces pseudovenezuelae]|nr:hypothetical protein [Streptomyces pseudovenezuelae]